MPRTYRGKKYRAASKIQGWFRKRRKKNLAKKVKTLAKKVNSNIEHRWQDVHNFTDSFGVAGLVKKIGLENIAVTPSSSNLEDNRIGNKITLKRVYLKGQLAVSDSHNFCRMLLVRVTNMSQLVSVSDILEPAFGSVLPTIYSPYRKDSTIKYKILHDKFYKLQQKSAGSTYPDIVNFDLSYTWKSGLTITYLQDTASDPIYGQIYLVCISDSSSIPHPSFRSFKRLSWIA